MARSRITNTSKPLEEEGVQYFSPPYSVLIGQLSGCLTGQLQHCIELVETLATLPLLSVTLDKHKSTIKKKQKNSRIPIVKTNEMKKEYFAKGAI